MVRYGKYFLHERIAAGGMAEVFKGSLSGGAGFERSVAIKRILPQLGEDSAFVAMFIDEAKIAVQLSHSNIAQIFDLGRVEDTYFIAMEYVHGKDVRSLLARANERREPGLPVPIACHVAMRVAEALHHAHNASGRDGRPLGVIHRDISPQNVLVSFEGEVKVVDFGLAKAKGRATQTQAGVVKGKLSYLSPQQARGEDIDHRSDIYSLGLVLFEMLTGRRMFARSNDIETVIAVQSNDVVPLRRVARHLPAALEPILACTLEDDPDLRYRTAMELHDALEVFVYEHGALCTRRDVASFVRSLFEPQPAPKTTVSVIAEEPTRTDTIPAPPPDTVEDRHDTWITQLHDISFDEEDP